MIEVWNISKSIERNKIKSRNMKKKNETGMNFANTVSVAGK